MSTCWAPSVTLRSLEDQGWVLLPAEPQGPARAWLPESCTGTSGGGEDLCLHLSRAGLGTLGPVEQRVALFRDERPAAELLFPREAMAGGPATGG